MKRILLLFRELAIIYIAMIQLQGCQCGPGSCSDGRTSNQKNHLAESGTHKTPCSDNETRETASVRSIENIPVERGGKFFITGTEIVYIQNGSIEWQSSEIKKYAKSGGKFYIATGNNLFCTDNHGSIIWKMTLKNSGSCSLENGELLVFTDSGIRKFNPTSGKTIQ
jgi:hypothetical protein